MCIHSSSVEENIVIVNSQILYTLHIPHIEKKDTFFTQYLHILTLYTFIIFRNFLYKNQIPCNAIYTDC